MTIYDLPSPAVYVDIDLFKKNAEQLKKLGNAANKRVRPHFKAHKSVYIAKVQQECGFTDGFTAARLGEAEVLVDAGFDNILVAFPLYGKEKWDRYAALNNRAKMYTTVDSYEIARGLSDACGCDNPARVLIEVDAGVHRCGVQPNMIKSFAQEIMDLPGIVIDGLFDYNGTMYFAKNQNERYEMAAIENNNLLKGIEDLKSLGIECKIVSVGNTPGSMVMDAYTAATEVRAGKRFFYDVSDVDCGFASLEDCAIRILATVVSTPLPGKATIDAGSKRMTSDNSPYSAGYGAVLNYQGVEFNVLHEEHGFLTYDPDKLNLKVGDRVIIIPNHACVISNLCDYVHLASGEQVIGRYPVDARGMEF